MDEIAKRCPKCDARIKFMPDQKIAHCKVCKKDFAITHAIDKEPNDEESYTLSETTTLATLLSRIMLITVIIVSVGMILFALYADFRMTDGLEERNNSYKSNI